MLGRPSGRDQSPPVFRLFANTSLPERLSAWLVAACSKCLSLRRKSASVFECLPFLNAVVIAIDYLKHRDFTKVL